MKLGIVKRIVLLLITALSSPCGLSSQSVHWPEAGLTLSLENGKVVGRDITDTVIIAPQWNWIQPYGDIAVVTNFKEGKAGAIDTHGNVIIEPRYTALHPVLEATSLLFIVASTENADGNSRYGLITRTGQEIIPLRYERLDYEKGSDHFRAVLEGKEGIIRSDGHITVPLEYDSVYIGRSGSPSFWVVSKAKRSGVIDVRTGDTVILPVHDTVSIRGEFVVTETRHGSNSIIHSLLNTRGQMLWSPQHYPIHIWGEETLAIVSDGERGALGLDAQGRIVLDSGYQTIHPLKARAIASDADGKYGLINVKGEKVVPFQYDNAYPFDEQDWLLVTVDGLPHEGRRLGLINEAGHTILNPAWSAIRYDTKFQRFFVERDGKLGILDRAGKEIFPPIFDRKYAIDYEDSRYIVEIGDTVGMIDINAGTYIIPAEYEAIASDDFTIDKFRILAVRKKGKWGFITLNNQVLIPLRYDAIIGDVDHPTGIARMQLGKKIEQISVATPEQRIEHNLQGIIGITVPEANPLIGSLVWPKIEARYLPLGLSSETDLFAAVKEGKLREVAYPSILISGDSAYVGFGNIVHPRNPIMDNMQAVCATQRGFELLIRNDQQKECANHDEPRLQFQRGKSGRLICLDCEGLGIPRDWIRKDFPPGYTGSHTVCATPDKLDPQVAATDYAIWLGRFESELLAFINTPEDQIPESSNRNAMFKESVAPFSRMSHLLGGIVSGSRDLPPAFNAAPTLKARAKLLLDALRQAVPVSGGGIYPEVIEHFPQCSSVWYVRLPGTPMASLPPEGKLVRDSFPFLNLLRGHNGFRLVGISKEFMEAIVGVGPNK